MKILDTRLSNALRSYPEVTKEIRGGSRCQVIIRLPNVISSMSGVRYARSATQGVVSAMEGV
jgi:hypothetical protein